MHQPSKPGPQPSQEGSRAEACVTQFGKADNDSVGMTAYAALAGQHYSSYRAECLGALLAIAASGPCHIGIDNAACVRTCNQLLELAAALPANADVYSTQVLQKQ